jgi:hypothetical protein
VPRKFVPGLVPAFPVRLQPPAPAPTAWQATLPSLFTTRTAVPAAQAPETRCCNAALSSPSSWSAFNPPTLVEELTVNGATPALTTNDPAGPPPVFFAYTAAFPAPPVCANRPVPKPVLSKNPVAVLLLLLTPNPEEPAAAFVFVTCNCAAAAVEPVSVVFAFTEFDTPKLNTPLIPLPATPPSRRQPAHRQTRQLPPSRTTLPSDAPFPCLRETACHAPLRND